MSATKLIEVKVLMEQEMLDKLNGLASMIGKNRDKAVTEAISIAHDLVETTKKEKGKILLEYPNHRIVELTLTFLE